MQMKHPLYLAYGLLLLGFAGAAQYRGWSFNKVNELKDVPRTIRDNPGSYRSHFAGYIHYTGGK
jgi:hypothetical protein